jgi:hypothetical protein
VILRIVGVRRLIPDEGDRTMDADNTAVGCDLVSARRPFADPS